jgi:OOP family OmpA-OmpF porin
MRFPLAGADGRLRISLLMVTAWVAGCANHTHVGQPLATAGHEALPATSAQAIDELQTRIRKLNEQGLTAANYSVAKAQCWLDTAWSQYSENDRSGFPDEALAESTAIVSALESDKSSKAGFSTPFVVRSAKVRDDLWTRVQDYKTRTATLSCTARHVACAEVQLVRAGHALNETGWRQASPYVNMAEDALRRAGVAAARCSPSTAQAPAQDSSRLP